jgi:hypothetical protein
VKVENPDRPKISQKYEGLLRHTPEDLQKEALKHEWDWQGYADKMEDRIK